MAIHQMAVVQAGEWRAGILVIVPAAAFVMPVLAYQQLILSQRVLPQRSHSLPCLEMEFLDQLPAESAAQAVARGSVVLPAQPAGQWAAARYLVAGGLGPGLEYPYILLC